ncbi:MAG: sensor histidine kinase [Rhodobacteraceae bacterium]|nr:sensor histidine kinase [Paracoccaceae bacterium]
MLGLVLCLPIAGLFLFSFYANQLVQQTEESLLTQASVLSATFAVLYAGALPENADFGAFTPVFPSLSLNADTILPPRPEAVEPEKPASEFYLEIGVQLSAIVISAKKQTLVGYRLLDIHGIVIGGTAEVGLSLAGVTEVATALNGQIASVPRVRLRETPEPALYALSRGTRVRIFVAMPVVVDGQVIGAVYLSRTPNHIFRFLYGERVNLAKAAGFVVLATGLIGFVFWRFITRPVHELINRTRKIGANPKARWRSAAHAGTREFATLGDSFQTMATRLQDRQEAIDTFTSHVTHELKSPLTAVRGAAELLRESKTMSDNQRNRFLENILSDTKRMEVLLKAMRDLAQSEQPMAAGASCLQEVQEQLSRQFDQLDIQLENEMTVLPVQRENMAIILGHLLENAAENGAQRVILTVGPGSLRIRDDGNGISDGNLLKIMSPFFTTRREVGGTGMGLSIVKSMLDSVGGKISVVAQQDGACFLIEFPTDDNGELK